ncbi:MAG: hypothetical protein HY056_06930 [Proteobacteria bacterium]|nr:hypothetical protein [Pseudomonadota bacterium]
MWSKCRASGGAMNRIMIASKRLAEAAVATVLLLVPALWNGFPLLQYDSGGYLARWYEGYLVPSRSSVYGLFALSGWPLDFWPVIAVQAMATVWIVALVLRVHAARGRYALLGTIAALAILTGLPWIVGILLTDIFAGVAVLALHLLVLRAECLGGGERAACVGLVAFAAASHSATFAVLLAMLLLAALVWPWRRASVQGKALLRATGALGLGAAMLLAANFALSGRVAWTPGGYGIVFARMLEDGIVRRYLDEHCPDTRLRLCDHRGEIGGSADEFLWGGELFNRLGRFAKLGEEMRMIVLESLRAYPGTQARAATSAALRQFVRVRSGEGVVDSIWHTYAIIERYIPSAVPAMRAARQQRGEIAFTAINRLHFPVALLSMLLLPALVILCARLGCADIGLMAATVLVALVANAVVCGVLSNPHDRYGARLAWVATLTVALVPLRLRRTLPRAG